MIEIEKCGIFLHVTFISWNPTFSLHFTDTKVSCDSVYKIYLSTVSIWSYSLGSLSQLGPSLCGNQ